ncbi:penicillin-binding protein 1A [Phreatobacter aquaticus]|uniref:Penicillin-binding protein 1A n=1 Tax=Phreatobacter aquaticus TaxID=2570229 RepID=A0A4D7QG19_9HYPH|nr:penicillin-binding protein 1A [Phreatobacter aquaticus]QCK86860.1 penicillin-binding protein 1A [Phreatobacter aquaticus]
MKFILRFFGWAFGLGTVAFLLGAAGVALYIIAVTKELPDYTTLRNYEPPIMSRVHAADGQLMAEYARERRLYLPIQAVPKLVVQAFLAAEDKNFYTHNGIDFTGIARAALTNFQNRGSNRRPQGASTITQQVAKNFLLTGEQTVDRKVREALIAMRMESAFTKDQILELYLNEIYLGFVIPGYGAYGVAAAALVYFDKSVHELTIPEAAYLAALPKSPTQLHPFRNRDRAIERRNYVISRMVEDGHITAAQGEEARRTPLTVNPRSPRQQTFAADYFSEEVRREMTDRFGEKKLMEGGLSIRTTLDPRLQVAARATLAQGLIRYDEARGWRGPVTKIEDMRGDWGVKLADMRSFNDTGWKLAVVIDVQGETARIGLQPGREQSGQVSSARTIGLITAEGARWTRRAMGRLLNPGDVVYVEPITGRDGQFRLRQIPEVSGGLVAMDPYTGRVLAMVGGFSFDQSQFNRATQARRQPGSSFKPFVYAAALDNGYTPSTVVMDAPFELAQPDGSVWRPENYSGQFYGPQTLRFGIERSRNVMTVRLANDVGMPLVAEYAKRFGVYDDMPALLSYALGAGETTLMRMVTAYSMFANGGRRIRSTLIDRIQDRTGQTIFRHDDRQCQGCTAERWANQDEPILIDRREQVLDPMTAYQITSMMEGVVLRGTGVAIRELNKPIAGKTGTSNEEKDAWFVGFSPDLAVGIYIGYDTPKPMGGGGTGGGLSAPVFRDFMRVALADRPAIPFRVPTGIKLIRIDPRSGLRAGAGGTGAILEAFKPGTAPPDSYQLINPFDAANANGPRAGGRGPSSESNRAISTGTGGLY